ncbi:hypothetical protein ACLMJK_008549 [Lecanora helva]
MKALSRSLGLGLLLCVIQAFAQDVVTQTISINTGSCSITSSAAASVSNARSGVLSGSSPAVVRDYGSYSFLGSYALSGTKDVDLQSSSAGQNRDSFLSSSLSTTTLPTASNIPSPAATGDPCSGSNKPVGVEVATDNSQSYNVSCGVLFDSDILTTVNASTFQGCLALCDNYSGCIAVSYLSTQSRNNCQLLSAISEVIYGESDFDSGHSTNYTLPADVVYSTLLRSAFPSTSTSKSTQEASSSEAGSNSSPSAISSSAVIVSSSSSVSTTSAGILISVESSSAAVNLPSPVAVTTSSALIPTTSSSVAAASSFAFSENPVLTAAATTLAAAQSSAPNEDTVLSAAASTSELAGLQASPTQSSPEPTIGVEPDCSAYPQIGNYTRYVDRFAVMYDIRCALGIEGQSGDVGAYADTFTHCLEYCSLLENCTGVTYTNGNDPAGGDPNCNPYYSFTGYTSANVDNTLLSAVAVDGPSTGAVGSDDLCGDAYPSDTGARFGPDTFAVCYSINCGQYMSPGDSLFSTDMTTLEGCLTYCSDYPGCMAVSWSGPHQQGVANNSNCLLMASTGSVSPEAAADNAYASSTACAQNDRIALATPV